MAAPPSQEALQQAHARLAGCTGAEAAEAVVADILLLLPQADDDSLLPALSHALARHHASVEVCEAACRLLLHLSGARGAVRAMLRERVAAALLEALRPHTESLRVCSLAVQVAAAIGGPVTGARAGLQRALLKAHYNHPSITSLSEMAMEELGCTGNMEELRKGFYELAPEIYFPPFPFTFSNGGVNTSSVAAWRAAHPEAVCFAGLNNAELTDADFVHLRGLKGVSLHRCPNVTDAAFAHLAGIEALDLFDMPHITDAAFKHLQGIKYLSMAFCVQLTDAALEHLSGIQALDVQGLRLLTGATFPSIAGVRTLNLAGCTALRDEALPLLGPALQWLNLARVPVTDAAFVGRKGLRQLCLRGCTAITDAALASVLEGGTLEHLELAYCKQAGLTGAPFASLPRPATVAQAMPRVYMQYANQELWYSARAAGLK